jgi:hypothetical protein
MQEVLRTAPTAANVAATRAVPGLAVVSSLSGRYPAVIRPLSGRYPAVIQQLSSRYIAVSYTPGRRANVTARWFSDAPAGGGGGADAGGGVVDGRAGNRLEAAAGYGGTRAQTYSRTHARHMLARCGCASHHPIFHDRPPRRNIGTPRERACTRNHSLTRTLSHTQTHTHTHARARAGEEPAGGGGPARACGGRDERPEPRARAGARCARAWVCVSA